MSIFETLQNAYQCRLHAMEVKACKIKISPADQGASASVPASLSQSGRS